MELQSLDSIARDLVDGVGIESFSAKCKPVPYAERLIKEASKGLFARIIP